VTLSLREKEKKRRTTDTGIFSLLLGTADPPPITTLPVSLFSSSSERPTSKQRTISLKLKNREPKGAPLAGPLPIGRVGSSSLPTPRCISRKRLPAPGTPGEGGGAVLRGTLPRGSFSHVISPARSTSSACLITERAPPTSL
jgi:hypothetical protein